MPSMVKVEPPENRRISLSKNGEALAPMTAMAAAAAIVCIIKVNLRHKP
jgi:hypothetical protein